jgi:glucan phosphoethanolaminetransferase (alkaline phosphatase superfamily)
MALKLFRSTGYSSILSPGETQAATHPGWIVAAVSAWIGFVCNVALWRQIAAWPDDGAGLVRAVTLGIFIGAACAIVLSVLGWRKTLKLAATLMLFLAALAASGIWGQALPVDATLMDKRLSSVIVPSWASLLRWQTSALLVGLALLPTVWVWHTRVRRLSGPQQLGVNVQGGVLAGIALAASGFLLLRGVV